MESCQEEKDRCYFVYGHYKSERKKAKPIICTNSNTGQILKFSSSYKFAKFLGISSNAHILDVLNNKRSNIKGWEVKYDL